MPLPVLLAAVDLGPQTARVLYHAAGLARVLDLKLNIVHVSSDVSSDAHRRLLEACLQLGPYVDIDAEDVVVRSGRVSEAIILEARRELACLIVMGARGRRGVMSLVLGTTSEAVLRGAAVPVLLVPANDIDIVSVDDGAALTCGPIVAAVDLEEECAEQLYWASLLAHVASQPLVMMTVAKSRVTDEEAEIALRRRGQRVRPKPPSSLLVRRGPVPEEIARCVAAEGAGLVVMGLRATPKCQPGSIAGPVLKTQSAFVLAVPGVRAAL